MSLAQDADKPLDPDLSASPYGKYVDFALGMVGTEEGKDDRLISQFFGTTTLGTMPSSVPWCAAFICWLLEQFGFKSTGSAAASENQYLGVPCADNVPGAIMVWEHMSGKLRGHYHTNILVSKLSEDEWKCVGGNQYKAGCDGAITVATYGPPNYRLASSRLPLPLYP